MTGRPRICDRWRWVTLVVCWLSGVSPAGAREPVSFNRDIRPILSEHCWKCHGFDAGARQSGLRLDERSAATAPADSGDRAIVPGDVAASELISRLTTTDESLRMPPAGHGKRPTAADVEMLKQWIAEGAPYARHWAFDPINGPDVPASVHDHPIDAFVSAKLKPLGLTFAPEADRDTLIRRVYFDLVGLPPTLEELNAARSAPWEGTVDRLLASPHFGERMAVDWLDAARFADTDGYFGDKPRQVWLWRDWVIDAFNRNLPFDQFTTEQLAGDLLPGGTVAQKIATGFNRNHMSNDETGLIDEEYRVEYVVDRVDTTMSTWLGLTVGCAQCHDHKYDPISQREYYSLFAFFNNVPENGLLSGSDAPPRISVPSPEQSARLTELEQVTTQAVAAYEPLRAEAALGLAEQEATILAGLVALPDGGAIHVPLDGAAGSECRALGTSLKPNPGIRHEALRFDGTQHVERDVANFPVESGWTLGIWLISENSLGCPVSKIEATGDRRGVEVLWQKGKIGVNLVDRWGTNAIEVVSREKFPVNEWRHVVIRHDGSRTAKGLSLLVNGQPIATEVRRDEPVERLSNDQPLRLARRDEGLGFYGSLDEFRWVPRSLSNEQIRDWYRSERIRGALERPADKRAGREVEWLLDDHIDHRTDAPTRAARDAVRTARAAEKAVRDAIPTALVMEEKSPPRATHVLERGVYNKPAGAVDPGVPAALSPWPLDAPRNRLGFARWLTNSANPLTARVAVNRLWRQCFGEGLVRTVNDFGTQGEPPTHPALLDYLAARYREDWDTKRLLKLIVTSRTYRQSSALRAENEEADPENRWLIRGPRFRMPLEMIRDQALVASGLLVRTVGGPSVKPYQPPGLWEEVSYNADSSYEVDGGAGAHRRSLYTFIKRQAPPPALLVFDGPTREKCTLKRARTNTPLQALVLLNDQTYIEAARELAVGVLQADGTDRDRLCLAVRRVLSREPTAAESTRLLEYVERNRNTFAGDPRAAELLAGRTTGAPEVAAWTMLVHTLMNLDEAITRR